MIVNTDKIEIYTQFTLTEFITLRKWLRGPDYTTDPDYKEWVKLNDRLDKIFASSWSSYQMNEYYKRRQEEKERKKEEDGN